MNPYYASDNIAIYNADVLDALREMPSESVHVVVTSPPYYQLRTYLDAGHPDKVKEIGLEASPSLWIDKMVEVFREVRRVMRKDGTAWINCGDSYAGSQQTGGNGKRCDGGRKRLDELRVSQAEVKAKSSLPPKSLLMMPARLAIAMQADGWVLRSDVIWAKPNPMPESVRDRPTSAHEHLFMFAKSQRYYYDVEAVKETAVTDPDSKAAMMFGSANGKNNTSEKAHAAELGHRWKITSSRNMQNVLWLSPEPSKLNHFATYPRALVRPCVRAGTSEKGVCSSCGSPHIRIVRKGLIAHDGKTSSAYEDGTTAKRMSLLRQAARERGGEYENDTQTLGWRASCTCNADIIPATVLDPFFGSGTTGLVCLEEGRRCIGVDLSEEYCRMAVKRLRDKAPLFMAAGELVTK